MNKRYFIRKKEGFRQKEENILQDIQTTFPELKLEELKLFTVLDVFNLTETEEQVLKDKMLCPSKDSSIFSPEELAADVVNSHFLGIEPVEGQFDQRAAVTLETLRLFSPETKAIFHSADLYTFPIAKDGDNEIFVTLRDYLLNPVAEQEKDFSILELMIDSEPWPLRDYAGFLELNDNGLLEFISEEGLAMSLADIKLIQDEFQKQGRAPTEVEMKVLDTYWSDHCRHSTFNTELTDIRNQSVRFREDLDRLMERYQELKADNARDDRKPSLMELATIIGRDMRRRGVLDRQEVSDEINACSIYVDVENQGKEEPWLLMFKNETHNHPTEMEPFGGAGTCLGGAIRDPLSGRAHVYQALRITGAGNINTPFKETRDHKLPQAYISKTAAKGYSDYSNQIGVAGTTVREIVHPGYVAKRMELGAVVAAAPVENVLRATPEVGDVIVLVGGPTGRDGIGGATGSSQAQDKETLKRAGAEVQKGNPPAEAGIMRLFRKTEIAKTIRKCNDFGAGGVSVAVGELADSLDINLDLVPTKYPGLNAMEIAISESQERMAVLLAKEDEAAFIAAAEAEDLEAITIAKVTDSGYLRMFYQGETVLELSRKFLDTNGARREQDVILKDYADPTFTSSEALKNLDSNAILKHLSRDNHGTQGGLAQQFDATIGRSTVLLPYGGKYQKSEEMVSVQTLPVLTGSQTASAMSYGYSVTLADNSPYLMGAYSVIEALAKLVAAGIDYRGAFLSNQEFFRRLDDNSELWGNVFQALLGLMEAQEAFGVASIGGKDSMSGSFEDIHVPDTLVTFAVNCAKTSEIVSVALPAKKSYLFYLSHPVGKDLRPNYEALKENFELVYALNKSGKLLAASTIRPGGLSETLAKMSLGNRVGITLDEGTSDLDFTATPLGGIVIAVSDKQDAPVDSRYLGIANPDVPEIVWRNGVVHTLDQVATALCAHYEKHYPTLKSTTAKELPEFAAKVPETEPAKELPTLDPEKAASVKVLIPHFFGSNTTSDLKAAFKSTGADVEVLIIRKKDAELFRSDLKAFQEKLAEADILALGGSYNLANYLNGGGSYIASFLSREDIHAALTEFVEKGGLVLGINNGFQALVRAGFLPGNDSADGSISSLAFAANPSATHISRMVQTKLLHNSSPWLADFSPGEIHTLAISQSEGQILVDAVEAEQLFASGQVAAQYVDFDGNASMKETANPSQSAYAIEALVSQDGRIFGKMAHSERYFDGLMKNIPGNKNQDIFTSAVRSVANRR